jgi:hypothetical protein
MQLRRFGAHETLGPLAARAAPVASPRPRSLLSARLHAQAIHRSDGQGNQRATGLLASSPATPSGRPAAPQHMHPLSCGLRAARASMQPCTAPQASSWPVCSGPAPMRGPMPAQALGPRRGAPGRGGGRGGSRVDGDMEDDQVRSDRGAAVAERAHQSQHCTEYCCLTLPSMHVPLMRSCRPGRFLS